MIRRIALITAIAVSTSQTWSLQHQSFIWTARRLDDSSFMISATVLEEELQVSSDVRICNRVEPRPRTRTHRPNSTRAESWNEKFEELVSFKNEYGHTNVPQNPTKGIKISYPQLATFCRNMRTQYRHLHHDKTRRLSFLTQDRIERLESIGFVWSSHEAAWNFKYEELVKFWKTHGHTNVSSRENPDLRNWVGYQRLRYKAGSSKFKPLTTRQIQSLESIQFRWSPKDEKWWKNYAELKILKEKNGNLNVPCPKLRRWKDALRRACREYVISVSIEGTTDGVHVSGLNQERLEALQNIGFCWLPNNMHGPLEAVPPNDIFAGYQ